MQICFLLPAVVSLKTPIVSITIINFVGPMLISKNHWQVFADNFVQDFDNFLHAVAHAGANIIYLCSLRRCCDNAAQRIYEIINIKVVAARRVVCQGDRMIT